MKTYLKYTILFILISCSRRDDAVFLASDELHYLNLYRSNNDFEILYNGLNTAKGQYKLHGDTIFLTYSENEYLDSDKEGKSHANDVLTRVILIDKNKKSIHSLDSKAFCAVISLNELK